MLSRDHLDQLSRIRAALSMAVSHHGATDRANAYRNTTHEVRASPLTEALTAALTALDTVMKENQYTLLTDDDYHPTGYAPTGGSGDLLSHVVDTDADPAHVRDSLTDRQARDMLAESITHTGTTPEEAERLADLFVPITDTPWEHRTTAAAIQNGRISVEAQAHLAAVSERAALIRRGITPSSTYEQDVARHISLLEDQ